MDAVLGPPESGWVGGRARLPAPRATPPAAATRPERVARAPARHSTRSSRGSAGSASRRSTTSAGGWPSPPAEAYGVATFYALFATKPRPPVVAHVCDDIACRLAGAEDDLRGPDARRSGRPASRPATAAIDVAALARAWACASARRPRCSPSPARRPTTVTRRAGRRGRRHRRGSRSAGERRGASAAARADPATARGRPGRACSRRVGVVDPTSLDDYRAHGGYAALDAGARDRARGGHRRGHRVEADGPRRRRVPDRPQVGRGRDPAGPAALPRLQRRRVRARARSRTGS